MKRFQSKVLPRVARPVPPTRCSDVRPAPHPAVEPLEARRLMAAGTTVLRMNAGAGSFTDAGGNLWVSDRNVAGGTTNSIVYDVARTPDDGLYATRRWGNFDYSIPAANGAYTLNLLFADPLYTSAGKRKFNVTAEGGKILSDFDVAANGGGKAALVKSFPITVNDGRVNLSFRGVVENAIVSGVELQPRGAAPVGGQAPFGGAAASLPGTIEAENFDEGGEGVAYHDRDARNNGGQYRSTGVDVGAGNDGGPIHTVGWTYAGEWLEYTVNIPAAGAYDLQARVSSAGAGGRFRFELDGVNKTGSMTVPDTGNWDNYATVTKSAVSLPAGRHVLRLVMETDGATTAVGSFNWLKVVARSGSSISWGTGPSAPISRVEAGSIQVGNKLYVMGGFLNFDLAVSNRLDVLNLETRTWSRGPNLPSGAPQTHQGMATDGRYFYMVGGQAGGGYGPATPKSWRYDTVANQWSSFVPLPVNQSGGTLAYLNGELHYVGGDEADRETPTGAHWALRPGAKQWQARAPLPIAGDHLSNAVIGGKMYAVGGEHGHAGFDGKGDYIQHKYLFAYDPSADDWTRRADMPLASSHSEGSTLVINNKIVVLGGQLDDIKVTSAVRTYDPAADKWTLITSLPEARKGAAAAYYNGKIYLTNGQRGGDYKISNVTWIGTPQRI